MTEIDYLVEALKSSMEEHNVDATEGQIAAIAKDIQVSIDCKSQMFYVPENPMIKINNKLEAELKKEKSARFCRVCCGRGSVTESFGPIGRSSTMTCHACGGSGKIY